MQRSFSLAPVNGGKSEKSPKQMAAKEKRKEDNQVWMPGMQQASEEEAERQVKESDERSREEKEDNSEEAKYWAEFEPDESRLTRHKRIPSMPTQREIDEHMIHHIPSRSWCEFCRYGRGHDDPLAKKRITEELAIPEIFLDYMYLKGEWPFNQAGDDEGELGMPIIVMKDRESRFRPAMMVPAKGVNSYAVKAVSREIVRTYGYEMT